jgi:small subunit ribosomal protein S2
MTLTPDALFIIDTHQERAAAEEALKMGTPTVGITDTNSDPMIINYPIPANDDAVGSLKLIINYVVDAWIEGRQAKGVEDVKAQAIKEKEETEAAAKAAKEAKAAAKPKADFFGINTEDAGSKKDVSTDNKSKATTPVEKSKDVKKAAPKKEVKSKEKKS